jgi:hypothetical protein
MTNWINRILVLVMIAAIISAPGMTRAEESPRDVASGPLQPERVDVVSLQPGAEMVIRTASLVDLPGVVQMRTVDGSLRTVSQGQVVTQSRQTLTVCPPGCTTPVVVPKPDTTLVAVVLRVESGIARILLSSEKHDVALLPMVAIVSAEVRRENDLVGAPIAITIGDVVETPHGTVEPHSPAERDVFVAGTRLKEVAVEGQDTRLLLPAPGSHLEGDLVAVERDVLTVRLLGRSQVITVPRAAIASLKVRRTVSRTGTGALIGAAVPLVARL